MVTSCLVWIYCAGGSQGTGDSRDEHEDEGNDEDSGGDEIAGTSKLEVENAWLKSELASAVAMLCNLDPDYELEEGAGDSQDPEKGAEMERGGRAQIAAQKTSEALQLKDEHAKHLLDMLSMRQVCWVGGGIAVGARVALVVIDE